MHNLSLTNLLGVFIVSMLPIIELRGAIPLGLAAGLPFIKVLSVAIVGNCLVVVPLLYVLNNFMHYLERMPFLGRFFRHWFRKVEKKSDIISKYGFWGLFLFVAVPLPGSGVWSGSLAAVMLEIEYKKALLACVLGVFAASLIVTLATTGILSFIR